MMKTTHQLIDELEKEMDNLRKNYPELFKQKHSIINRYLLNAQQLASSIEMLGRSLSALEEPFIVLGQQLAREQARKQAGWLQRARWRAEEIINDLRP